MGEDVEHLRGWAFRILDLSQRLLELAKSARWDEMIQLETERRQLIDKLFSHPKIDTVLSNMSDLLEQVLNLDAQSIDLSVSARRDLANALNKGGIHRSERVVDIYNSFQH